MRSNESVFDIVESNRCDLSELEKRLNEIAIALKGNVKQKENQSRQQKARPLAMQPNDMEICLLNVKHVSKKLKRIGSSYQRVFEMLQEENTKQEQLRESQLRRRIREFEDELKICEGEYSKNIMTLTQECGRKEQAYQAMCTNFVNSLNSAYRVFSKLMGDIEQRCKRFVVEMEERASADHKYRDFYEDIICLVGQLNLKPGNGDSIEHDFSYADSPNQRNTNKNTIEMSSIEQVEEQPSEQLLAKSKEIEHSLKLLTKIGFFNTKNEDHVNKMFAIAKRSGSHNNLLQSPIYPVLLDLLKNNLRQNEEQSSHDPSIIQEESVSLHSALSHREDNVDSMISRHLDVEQLDEDSRQQL